MSIRIISIGKKHEPWVDAGIQRYQKRLKGSFKIEWVFLPHSLHNDATARQEESQRILSRLNANDYVILLDENGVSVNSIKLSKILMSKIEMSKKIVIIIGGAYGVDEAVKLKADYIWSLSQLVFPHQLVRLILTEQLYRSQEITRGNPYHHG